MNRSDYIEKIFKMNDLDCAHCADRMEQAIAKIDGVSSVSVNFMAQKMVIEAADVIIMDDKPSKILKAIMVATKTRRIVFQNIVFALGIKFAVMLLGAFGLANMWIAVFADVGVSVIAILNAMRTLKD